MSDRIEEIRARCEAATPGPWWSDYSETIYGGAVDGNAATGKTIFHDDDMNFLLYPANAVFIAHSREDIPYLLSQLDTAPGRSDLEQDLIVANARVKELENESLTLSEYRTAISNIVTQISALEADTCEIGHKGTCCPIGHMGHSGRTSDEQLDDSLISLMDAGKMIGSIRNKVDYLQTKVKQLEEENKRLKSKHEHVVDGVSALCLGCEYEFSEENPCDPCITGKVLRMLYGIAPEGVE